MAPLHAILAARRLPCDEPSGRSCVVSSEPSRDHQAVFAFLAQIAHDLRTPLIGVAGMADLLVDTDLTAEQQLFVQTIKSSAAALIGITNDILDHAKIKANGLTLFAEPFDLEQVIKDVITLMLPITRRKGIRLLMDYDTTLPSHFIGDGGRLRQVLTNLVSNAVKFTAKGQVLIRVVGLEMGGATYQVNITVEDTGVGIRADDLDRIFDEFHQVGAGHVRAEGIGLGLAIAKHLVERMKGAIWVDSELGRGSSFGFHLPLATAQRAHAPHPDGPTQDAQQPPPELDFDPVHPRPMRVLVAEDNRTNQLVFQKMVRDLAVDVVFANTGAEAVEAFQHFKPDLIFMDISMPEMDGYQAAQAIRQMEAGRSRLPILALTAQGSGFAPTLGAGIDRHLTKPLHKAALRDVMAAYCPKAAYVLAPPVSLAGAAD